MTFGELNLDKFLFWSKSVLLVSVVVPEAEMNIVEVILSNFQF